MAVSETNQARHRAILVSREFKWLFKAVPTRFQRRITSWFWRLMFLAEDGKLHLVGEHALAELREFCAPNGQSLFSTDPLVMARRAGRREVYALLLDYLNLDEATARTIMLLDDGLGDYQ